MSTMFCWDREYMARTVLAMRPIPIADLPATHDPALCEGEHCCIHNPSDHPMCDFRQVYRADRNMVERICPHGVGHPDPDHLGWVEREQGKEAAEAEAIHSCDGCCSGDKEPERVHLPKLIADEFEVSTSEARRLIVQGGVKIDGSTPLSFDYPAASLAGKTLTVGKRRSVQL